MIGRMPSECPNPVTPAHPWTAPRPLANPQAQRKSLEIRTQPSFVFRQQTCTSHAILRRKRPRASLPPSVLAPAATPGRQQETISTMHGLLSELHFTMRQLRRSPAFSAAGLFTLVLCIGANIVMFS